MAVSKKSLHEALRTSYMEKVYAALYDAGEDILRTASNRCLWTECSEWEKLNRATSMPESISSRRTF